GPQAAGGRGGGGRSCHWGPRREGAGRCGTKGGRPLRLRTRRISPRATLARGMLQRVQVVTTVSTLSLSSGIASAEPSTKVTGLRALPAFFRAITTIRDEGSRPTISRAPREYKRS